MKTILTLATIILVVATAALPRTWHIEPDGTGDAPTIQAGIDSAAAGDSLLLADGMFTGPGNRTIDYEGKAIVVTSESGDAEVCIIDCEGEDGRIYFQSGEGVGSVLDGVTFRNGRTGVEFRNGSSPTIRRCIFSGHEVAGMSFNDAGGSVDACRLLSNSGDFGGGIRCHGPGFGHSIDIRKCTFEGNSAVWGAGLYADCGQVVVIDSCFFYGNEALAHGGAIYWSSTELAEPDIRNCTFWGNSAQEGGAIWMIFSYFALYNCTFAANSAPVGSAVCLAYNASIGMYNCIIAYGLGGAPIYLGSGDYVDPWARLSCCDIYGNQGGDWTGIEDQLALRGNLQTCPAFCNVEVEPYDFHLCDGSPCAPGNHPDGYECGLMGAWDVGCVCEPTRTEATTWGGIKALYR